MPARCVVLRVPCPAPLGSCSPGCALGVLCSVYGVTGPLGSCSALCWLGVHCRVCGVLGHLAPVHQCARSVCCAVGCVCGASLRGEHSSIRTAAVHSRQGLSTLGQRTRPSGRRLFGTRQELGTLPGAHSSIRAAAVHSLQGLNALRARTRPSGRRLVFLGTCSRAVVCCVLWALSRFAAPGSRCCLAPVCVPWLWPAACLSGVRRGPACCAAPRPVRSLSVLWLAFSMPWCLSPHRGLAPGFTGWLRGARGGRPKTWLIVPAASPCRCRGTGLTPRGTCSGPAMGLSLAGPFGVSLGLRALQWLACVDPVTEASGFPYRPSFGGGLGRCTGGVSCGRQHFLLRVGGRHARVPCVCACARPSSPGQAGPPPGRVLLRLTFSFGRFVFLLCSAPSGLGLPLSCSFVCRFFCVVLFVRLRSLLLSLGSGPGCLGPWRSVFVSSPPRLVFFFRFGCAPPLSLGFSGFRPQVPWALALCVVCSVGLPPVSSSCALVAFVFSAWPLAAPWWLSPPPPRPFVSRRFPRCHSVPRFLIFFLALFLSGGLALVGGSRCLLPPPPPPPVCFAALSVLGSPRALAAFVFPVGPLGAPLSLLPPPPPSVSRDFVASAGCSVFFLLLCCFAPACLLGARWWFLPSAAPPPPFLLFVLLVCRCSALRVLSLLLCFPPGRWLLPGGCCPPPSPPFVSRGFHGCCSVLLFSFSAALLLPVCLALVGGLLPPHPVRAWCFGLSGVAALRCPSVRCYAVPCWPVLRCVLCCGALPAELWAAARCEVSVGASDCVLCCAVGCCCLLRRVSALCHPVGLFAVWFAVCFWSVLPCAVLCCVSLGAVLRRAAARCAARCCAVVCSVVLLRSFGAAACCVVPSGAARRPVLCGAVFCGVPPRCVLCAVCVLSWRAGARCCSPLWFVLCVSWGVVLCVPCPLCVVRLLCAVRVVCAVAGAWCFGALLCVVLFPLVFCGAVLGPMARGCLLVACCGVGVPVWPRGLLPCDWCGLLWCPASLCRALWCCAVAWCCAVVFCFRFAVLFVLALPSCGLSCGAVLCCVVLFVVCAVFCLVVASVCCGALSRPAVTHKKN